MRLLAISTVNAIIFKVNDILSVQSKHHICQLGNGYGFAVIE